MKLSNKILIGFFGLLFLYLTAVFAEVRFRGVPQVMDDTNSTAETAEIPGVAYLVIRDLEENVHVIGSDRPRLEILSLKGNLLRELTYTLSGDTLIISKLNADEVNPVKISVYIPSSELRGLTITRAGAVVKGFKKNVLHISGEGGRIMISENTIGTIDIRTSRGSLVDISGTELDTLSTTMEESNLYINSSVKVLKGSISNKSLLNARNIDEFLFRKDETSRLNIY